MAITYFSTHQNINTQMTNYTYIIYMYFRTIDIPLDYMSLDKMHLVTYVHPYFSYIFISIDLSLLIIIIFFIPFS